MCAGEKVAVIFLIAGRKYFFRGPKKYDCRENRERKQLRGGPAPALIRQ